MAFLSEAAVARLNPDRPAEMRQDSEHIAETV